MELPWLWILDVTGCLARFPQTCLVRRNSKGMGTGTIGSRLSRKSIRQLPKIDILNSLLTIFLMRWLMWRHSTSAKCSGGPDLPFYMFIMTSDCDCDCECDSDNDEGAPTWFLNREPIRVTDRLADQCSRNGDLFSRCPILNIPVEQYEIPETNSICLVLKWVWAFLSIPFFSWLPVGS